MNYFKNFGAECHLLKIWYIVSLASFDKPQGCQYNLPINLSCFVKKKHLLIEQNSKTLFA